MARKSTAPADKFRIGWHPTDNRLFLSIPDKLAFDSPDAFLWVVDGMHIRISPQHPPKSLGKPITRGRLQRNSTTPGCRIAKFDNIKGLTGKYFRPVDVTFQQVAGGDYQLMLPPEERRLEPLFRQRGEKVVKANGQEAPTPPAPTAAPAPPKEATVNVMVGWHDLGLPEDVVYEVPLAEIAALCKKWSSHA